MEVKLKSLIKPVSIARSLSVIALLVLLITGCIHKSKHANKDAHLTFLHVDGYNMINEHGEKVFLKSIGLGNWLLPEGYMWKFGSNGDRPRKIEKVVADLIGEEKAQEFWKAFRLNYITEADIIRIKDLGFNAVRPALNARLFLTETDDPQFVDEGFMHLENLIQWCKKHQLYVIIDMHGAPGGQTGQNIDDSPNNLPELFMYEKNQDALVKLWLKIVELYKDEPVVAAFDLLNEPLPERTGAAKEYGHLVEPLYKRLTNEIRKIDTKHMITLEGINWSNNWDIFGKPFDENTFYQFHYYCWNNPDNLNDISYFLKKRDTLNTPIWVGETGEKGNTIYWGTTQYFEKNNVSWSFWPWKKMDTKNTPYSIKKPTNWDQISDYTRDGVKPDSIIAEQAFNELLENIKLANCVYFEDVVFALFRKIPGKVEAENYMHGNYNETWHVMDTTKRSKYYRTHEFVPIELIAIDSTSHKWKWHTEQSIVLKANEWVTYVVNAEIFKDYNLTLKAKSELKESNVHIEVSGEIYTVSINSTNWTELQLKGIKIFDESTKIKLKVINGQVKIDWFDFK